MKGKSKSAQNVFHTGKSPKKGPGGFKSPKGYKLKPLKATLSTAQLKKVSYQRALTFKVNEEQLKGDEIEDISLAQSKDEFRLGQDSNRLLVAEEQIKYDWQVKKGTKQKKIRPRKKKRKKSDKKAEYKRKESKVDNFMLEEQKKNEKSDLESDSDS